MSKSEWKIDSSTQVGNRLDKFLISFFAEELSRSIVQKLIDSGHVKVNAKTVSSSYKLKLNDLIIADFSVIQQKRSVLSNPKKESVPLKILYEDEHVLFIDKPAGMVVHPGAGNDEGTLVNALLHYCGDALPSLGTKARAGLVHRLDKETSGVMVVAKTIQSLHKVAKQFAAHNHKKIYLALVCGKIKNLSGEIKTWYGRHPQHRIKYAVQKEGKGKIAIMKYKVTESFCEGKWHLVECSLLTGRTHQIRVQLSSIGATILGDKLYGKGEQTDTIWNPFTKKQLLKVERQMLHASTLEIVHPETQKNLQISAQIPEDFKQILSILRELSSKTKVGPS